VRHTAGVARERVDVVRDQVHRRHRPQGTVRPMRAVVQRVSSASVMAGGDSVASIGRGLLVLLGVRAGDGEAEADRIAAKLEALRVFEDDAGKMNLSVRDVGGELLVVSQFTLYGDARKGNRPSFVEAAPPEEAEPLYERVRAATGAEGGVFGARMAVALVNDGPVTVLLEA
jgi:D-aminoacyl-tRNA deacylase